MEPFGNPHAVREEAGRLRLLADRHADLLQRLQGKLAHVRFEGPAANRFRSQMRDRKRTAESLEHELRSLAAWLDSQAEDIARQNAEHRRRQELEAERAREAERVREAEQKRAAKP